MTSNTGYSSSTKYTRPTKGSRGDAWLQLSICGTVLQSFREYKELVASSSAAATADSQPESPANAAAASSTAAPTTDGGAIASFRLADCNDDACHVGYAHPPLRVLQHPHHPALTLGMVVCCQEYIFSGKNDGKKACSRDQTCRQVVQKVTSPPPLFHFALTFRPCSVSLY